MKRKISIDHWLNTIPGQQCVAWEIDAFDHITSDIFGNYALQIGHHTQIDSLRSNRARHKLVVDQTGTPSILAHPDSLPITDNSIDLLVLAHVLEESDCPQQILREAYRVLRPGGQIMISVFNPWSLMGLSHRIKHHETLGLSLARLKDWLALLGIQTNRGCFGYYRPPIHSNHWQKRLAFLEKMGNRWWPLTGSVFIVGGIKEVHGMRYHLRKKPWKKMGRHTAWQTPVMKTSPKSKE